MVKLSKILKLSKKAKKSGQSFLKMVQNRSKITKNCKPSNVRDQSRKVWTKKAGKTWQSMPFIIPRGSKGDVSNIAKHLCELQRKWAIFQYISFVALSSVPD